MVSMKLRAQTPKRAAVPLCIFIFIYVQVMIRPRTGDFLYTDLEFEIMLEDIRLFKHEGVTGVVFGVLCAEGTVDTARTRR